MDLTNSIRPPIRYLVSSDFRPLFSDLCPLIRADSCSFVVEALLNLRRLPLSRFTIAGRCCTLKFVFPAHTSSLNAAIPPPRDEVALMLLSSDRRPEFIRRGRTFAK